MAIDDLPAEIVPSALAMNGFLMAHFRTGAKRWHIPSHFEDRELLVLLAEAGAIRLMLDRGEYFALPPRRARS